MIKEAICTGKTVEEAIEAALLELNASRDDVSVEVLEMPAKKLLGFIGGNDAKVKVSFEVKEEKKSSFKKERRQPRDTHKEQEEKVSVDKGIFHGTMCEEYLKKIITLMGIKEFTVTSRIEESTIFVYIEGEGLGSVIGRRGDTLDALQHLANLVNRKDDNTPSRVILDCGDYRAKREAYLTRITRSAVSRAVRNNRCIALEPMNAYERRFVHTIVQESEGVSSRSVGEDPYRKVIIEAEGAPAYVERSSRRRNDRGNNRRRDDRKENSSSERPVYEREKGQPIGRRDGYVPHTKRDVSLKAPSDSSLGGHASDGELFSLYEKIEPKFTPREEKTEE